MFLYIPNLLSPGDHRFVQKRIPSVLDHPKMVQWFRKVFDDPTLRIELIEPRVYPTGSRGMSWHKDVPLGQKYECVYTVTNTSDSQTLHRDVWGRTHAVWTEPNSLVVLRPDDVWHGVTPVTRGERTIIKFMLV